MAFLSLGAASLLFSSTLAASAYAPVEVTCPATSLIRQANGLSSEETAYIEARTPLAADALKAWLNKTNSAYEAVTTLPTLALTSSGGGLRALLSGAGVIKALDGRDSNVSTSGLYQALTYHAGLSGGSWLLSSLAGNDWPTVSFLQANLWTTAFEETLFAADGADGSVDITADLAAKAAAGFSPTLTDAWGRLLSYQLLEGDDGGVATTISSVSTVSNFTSYTVPFPIITALGVKSWEGDCDPALNATQYEFTPYEFGSWDDGVAAFAEVKYLGTKLTGGEPTNNASCINGYDNLGYVLGTSSTLFNEVCVPASINSSELIKPIADFITELHEIATRDLFAVYPNPFYQYNTSSLVAAQEELELVDGGEAMQNNPIWPFLQEVRGVDVLIVNDNSADTSNNWPNGSEILTTYQQAQAAGLTLMPEIPSVETFISEGLNQRPTFFGCNDTETITIVYIPNYNYTYDSNTATLKLEYSANETAGMISNGVQIGSEGGDAQWGPCLACGIMTKTGEALPDECTICLAKYCYN